jgi:hypothetical protein
MSTLGFIIVDSVQSLTTIFSPSLVSIQLATISVKLILDVTSCFRSCIYEYTGFSGVIHKFSNASSIFQNSFLSTLSHAKNHFHAASALSFCLLNKLLIVSLKFHQDDSTELFTALFASDWKYKYFSIFCQSMPFSRMFSITEPQMLAMLA